MATWQEILSNLDIIIPVYQGQNKLKETIFSFGCEFPCNFTIVVDGDGINYLPELQVFDGIHNMQLLILEKNQGPGIARNAGLEITNKELVTFIDCGDTIINILALRNLLLEIGTHPEYNMISAAHYEENGGQIVNIAPPHNRMHGKVFRKEFLSKYNLRFNPAYPRTNEDIGINLAARMINQELSSQDGLNHICHFSDPVVLWKNDLDSITRRNNCAFYYKENNMGLAKNGSYAIELAQSHNVRDAIIENQIYVILVSLFNFYYATKNYRPEFLEEQEEGAIYFVKKIMQNREINYDIFINVYNDEIKNTYMQTWNPFCVKIPDMTFMQWYDMIKEKAKNYSIKEE